MIVSVPEELDADHMQVLNYAEETPNGMVRTETLSKTLGWDNERSNRALELLLGKGIPWLDTHRGETNYWFPSLWTQIRVDSAISEIKA
jgi:hypothetical protein